MYGMTQTTAIPSSSSSPGPSTLLPMVRKVRASVAPSIRGAGPPEGRTTGARTTSGTLHAFKGQKWSSFLENADSLRDPERRVDDRDDAGGSVMRLDSREMAIYGVCPETDRFTAVVCHYCGTILKPQAFKSHIKRHASDPSAATALQSVWADAKIWTDNHPDTLTSGVEDVSLDKKLKPPATNKSPKSTTTSAFLDNLEARDPGSLYSFKGQKWTTFLKNSDQLRNSERQAVDWIKTEDDTMRLDGTDLAIFGSSDTDRYTSVVCHFCGSVVKPQALQAHMNSHATDSSDDVQVVWTGGKHWTNSQRQEPDGNASEEVSTVCLDNQLKPPMTATACMSSGLPSLQHGTSPSKGTTAPPHTDSLESLDTLLHSDNLISNSAKASVPRKGVTGRGRGRQPGAKDREYDPDRHCGVPVESGKPCTRTLTCKSHALSLRRQVGGRSVPFDKLLLEHRNSRAARSRTSASGVQPDADSSNSSSSFDIERKSLSGASSSNSSCGHPPAESPLRHPTEEPDPADSEDSKIPIKLTDCSVTLNKLKREHTASILSKAKRQHLDSESPRNVQKQKSRPDVFDVSITSGQLAKVPPTTTVASVVSMEAPDISLQHISYAPEQQLTVAVPLSMISVMNLSGTIPCQEDSITGIRQAPPALHPDSGLFTLSNRARRDVQRSKLHLLRRSGIKNEEQETAQESIEEFPDIDTWHSTIPRPCQINCMKLRRIGGGSILSRRFCNFRKALLANMSTSMATTPGQTTISGSTSVGTVASLLSGRSGVGSTTTKHTTYLDKVNFPGERIKV